VRTALLARHGVPGWERIRDPDVTCSRQRVDHRLLGNVGIPEGRRGEPRDGGVEAMVEPERLGQVAGDRSAPR
jgi:hypothetical protein